MRKLMLILSVLAVAGTALYLWPDRNNRTPRSPDIAADLSALRLQATDLQRAVETLARSPDPDPAALRALAEKLDALTRRLEAIEAR